MAKVKKEYKVVGNQPVVVGGKSYDVGEKLEAVPGEVGFLVSVGALEEQK